MEDNEMEWKTRPMLGAQRIYLQQVSYLMKYGSLPSRLSHIHAYLYVGASWSPWVTTTRVLYIVYYVFRA
jgi:hypothetical protein